MIEPPPIVEVLNDEIRSPVLSVIKVFRRSCNVVGIIEKLLSRIQVYAYGQAFENSTAHAYGMLVVYFPFSTDSPSLRDGVLV